MQELMAIERIDQLRLRGFDHIIVRYSARRVTRFEILDKPALFADFLQFAKGKVVGRTYRFVSGMGLGFIGKSALDIYRESGIDLG